MSAHTPTPWERSKVYDEDDFQGEPQPTVDIFVALPDSYAYAYACVAELHCSAKGPVAVERMEANAAFIVRAVNAHDALVEALKDAVRMHIDCECPTCDGDTGAGCTCSRPTQWRAALALAEATP